MHFILCCAFKNAVMNEIKEYLKNNMTIEAISYDDGTVEIVLKIADDTIDTAEFEMNE